MPFAIAQHLSATRVPNAVLQALSPEAMLSAWLTANPTVADSMVYTGEHNHSGWNSWPDWLKKSLADKWETMVQWYAHGMPSPPPTSFTDPVPYEAGDPTWGFGLVMPKERGRHVYLSHLANGLALEMTGRLPWSITSYSAAALADLFSTEYWIAYLTPADATVAGYYFEELNSPSTPAHVMQFFTANSLIGTSAADTVARLFTWCRILTHYYTIDNNAPDDHAFWGPDAPPIPASMIINGTNFTGGSQPIFGHYTMGCGGTTMFMKSVLRALNIPVDEGTPPCGHTMPLFPTLNLALSHGDDPYDALAYFKTYPGWPMPAASEYFITIDQWNQWFGPSIDPNVSINNVGKRMGELAVQYLSDYLLNAYCADVASNATHASGQVFDCAAIFYTVADLEAIHLWDNLAAKATALNFCGSSSNARPQVPERRLPRLRPVTAMPRRVART